MAGKNKELQFKVKNECFTTDLRVTRGNQTTLCDGNPQLKKQQLNFLYFYKLEQEYL